MLINENVFRRGWLTKTFFVEPVWLKRFSTSAAAGHEQQEARLAAAMAAAAASPEAANVVDGLHWKADE